MLTSYSALITDTTATVIDYIVTNNYTNHLVMPGVLESACNSLIKLMNILSIIIVIKNFNAESFFYD